MEYDDRMTLAIQKAYYLQARNPSDSDILIQLAGEEGLDINQFSHDLVASETDKALRGEILLSRQLGIAGFPSLLLETNGNRLALSVDYADPDLTLQAINHYTGQ